MHTIDYELLHNHGVIQFSGELTWESATELAKEGATATSCRRKGARQPPARRIVASDTHETPLHGRREGHERAFVEPAPSGRIRQPSSPRLTARRSAGTTRTQTTWHAKGR